MRIQTGQSADVSWNAYFTRPSVRRHAPRGCRGPAGPASAGTRETMRWQRSIHACGAVTPGPQANRPRALGVAPNGQRPYRSLMAATILAHTSLASPNTMLVFSAKNSSFSTPEKPVPRPRLITSAFCVLSTLRIGMP